MKYHKRIRLADILEVVYALAAGQGTGAADLEQLRAEKARERGGFFQRLTVEDTS